MTTEALNKTPNAAPGAPSPAAPPTGAPRVPPPPPVSPPAGTAGQPPPPLPPPSTTVAAAARIHELEAELRGYKERDGAKALGDLRDENEALKAKLQAQEAAGAEARAALEERARLERRSEYHGVILTGVPEAKRDEIRLILAGMEAEGTIKIPAEKHKEAAEEKRAELVDRHPGWFSGGSAPIATPAGPGAGPMPDFMSLPEHVQKSMSQEDFEKHYGANAPRTKRTTLMG